MKSPLLTLALVCAVVVVMMSLLIVRETSAYEAAPTEYEYETKSPTPAKTKPVNCKALKTKGKCVAKKAACDWNAKRSVCSNRPTKAPTHAPTASPTPAPTVVLCQTFKQRAKCCPQKGCVNPAVKSGKCIWKQGHCLKG